MKMNQLVRAAAALLLCVIPLGSAFWLCPPSASRDFPSADDVFFTARGSCKEISVPEGFSAFFVADAPHLKFPSHGKIFALPLTSFPNYLVVLAHSDNLLELDMVLLGTEKQIIPTQPRSRIAKTPFSAPKFKKNAVKDDIIKSLDSDYFYSEMEKITGEKPLTVSGTQYTVKTRYTHTESNMIAATYFLERLNGFGYNATFQEFTYSARKVRNVIGVKQGVSDEIVVVGAHMDSISQDPNNLAPGCVDNGSGAEGVMLVAKAFAEYETQRTVHFILFGVEEQGLIGSNYYVDNLRASGFDVKYSLVMDMIGYSNQYMGVKIETSSSAANTVLANLMEENVRAYSPELSILRTTRYFGSDHVPFIDSGIPCFLAIEEDDTNYVGYHRTTDRVNYLSVEQSVGIVRGIAGTLYDLAA